MPVDGYERTPALYILLQEHGGIMPLVTLLKVSTGPVVGYEITTGLSTLIKVSTGPFVGYESTPALSTLLKVQGVSSHRTPTFSLISQ